MQHIHLVIQLLDHILPIFISVFVAIIVVALIVAGPINRYVAMVASADTVQGREDLAKYLAGKPGGSKIDVHQTLQSFIPAAGDLYRTHCAKLDHTH